MARASLLDVIEAAYDLEAPIDVWHGEIVAQACRAFPGAIGALGYRYRLEASLPVLTSAVLGDREFAGVPDQGHHSVDGEHLYRAYTLASHAEPTTIFHADPMTGKPPPVLCQMWKRLGVSDMFGVYATRRDGDSMTVGIAMPPRRGDDVRASDWRPLSRQWSCLARHLEIALAVREAVEQDGLAADFDLSSGDFRGGAVADRDLLLATARAVERERTAIGTGDSVSLGVWDQLLRGRWSMVRYRRRGGGVRFLAIENPRIDTLRRLSPIERRIVELTAAGESNKLIAAAVGLHESTIANVLARALRKLGIERRGHVSILARALGTSR